MQSQDLIESPEAARILGITVDQLRRRVKNGKVIPIIRKRNILLFSRKELSDSISEKNP
jgi:ribosomal protein L13E